jgi:hypothetical protein
MSFGEISPKLPGLNNQNAINNYNGILTYQHGGTGKTTLTANGIFYASSSSAYSFITPAANSVLVTDGSNIPSLSTTLPSAVQTNITIAESQVTGLVSDLAGKVPTTRTIGIDGTTNEISSSAGAQDLSANHTWTLSLPANLDLSGKTSLKIPISTSPTVSASGHIAIDSNTDNSNITQGSIEYFDGTQLMYVIAVDTLPSTNNFVLTYDGSAKKYKFAAQTGGGTTPPPDYVSYTYAGGV